MQRQQDFLRLARSLGGDGAEQARASIDDHVARLSTDRRAGRDIVHELDDGRYRFYALTAGVVAEVVHALERADWSVCGSVVSRAVAAGRDPFACFEVLQAVVNRLCHTVVGDAIGRMALEEHGGWAVEHTATLIALYDEAESKTRYADVVSFVRAGINTATAVSCTFLEVLPRVLMEADASALGDDDRDAVLADACARSPFIRSFANLSSLQHGHAKTLLAGCDGRCGVPGGVHQAGDGLRRYADDEAFRREHAAFVPMLSSWFTVSRRRTGLLVDAPRLWDEVRSTEPTVFGWSALGCPALYRDLARTLSLLIARVVQDTGLWRYQLTAVR